MMQKIITGDLKINSKLVPFYFDGERITIREKEDNEISAIFFRDSTTTEKHDTIYGTTDTGSYIVFFGVCYTEGRSNILAQGWAVSSGSVQPCPLRTFEAIKFTGYSIDAFFTPKRAIAQDYSHIPDGERHKWMPKLAPCPQNEYVQDFNIFIDNENIGIRLCVYTNYKLRRHERDIGTVTSQLVFKFHEPVAINKLPKYYRYAHDLMQFISFRQNIKFDSVILCKKSDNVNIGLYEIANCEFYTRNFELEYKNSDLNSITFEDIDTSVSKLFEYIASRRLNGVVTDDMYTPLSDSDYNVVSYPSFLSCVLSFEGEYNRCYPDQKANANPLFLRVKENIKTSILVENFDYQLASNKEKNKVSSYHKKFDRAIEMVDSSLEEKFNHLCKVYRNIISQFIKRVMNEKGIVESEKNNLGRALSEMRNSIGHGMPIPMNDTHVAAFRIARCFIYVLILDKSDVPHDNIKAIIEKMF